MIAVTRKLWALLIAKERRWAAMLLIFMLLASIAEIAGLMSVVPLVASLSSSADPCSNLGRTTGDVCARLLPSRDTVVLGLLVLGLIALSNALAFSVAWLSAKTSWAVWRRLAASVFEAYLNKPFSFFFGVHSSTLVKNAIYESERLCATVFLPLLILISRLVVTLAVILLVISVDPRVSVCIIALLAGLYVFVYRRLADKVRNAGDQAFAKREEIGRISTDTIRGMRELRMLGSERHFRGIFSRIAEILARQYEYGAVVSVIPRYVIETAAFAAMLGLSLYLSHSMGGWQTAAPLLAFYLFAAYRLLPQFQQIYANAMLVQQNAQVIDALTDLLRAHGNATGPEPKAAARNTECIPPIELKRVAYAYPGVTRSVLQEANMVVPLRSTVGLEGVTGAGKSTVIDLITGLIEPSSGLVTIGGMPLTAELAPQWRTKVGYVPQTLFLLDDTIRRNIAFGIADEEISQEQVEHAARLANIHDFVATLPGGYDTSVGEHGVRLSGGQRQRLVIARALYRDPEVLILDEATSALDAETEQAVLDAVRALSHRKTLLIVSHRPATLERCDLVYHIADGKITASSSSLTRTS